MLSTILCILFACVLPGTGDEPRLADCVVDGVRDLEARVNVEKADLAKLEKINRDFGILYRLRDVTIRYKEPDKFRMENRLGVYIVNGSMRYIRVPQLGLRKRDDMGAELARRHSLLDVGLLTTSRLEQLDCRYLRSETIRGRRSLVFEARFGSEDTGSTILWMDPERRHVLRRQWLHGDGKVRATFDYLDPKEGLPGVWLPTRVEIRNGDGELAGVSAYRELKLNQGLPDDLFVEEKPQSAERSSSGGAR